MRRAGPTLHDRVGLMALRLAKRQKNRYQSAKGREFYEEFFGPRHILQYEHDLRLVFRREEILRVLRTLPRKLRVLDLGCGIGHTIRLFPASYTKVGVDYSFSSLALARQQLPQNVSLVSADGGQLPFADQTFDLVACLEVLEHLEDDAKAVAEIARVLRPGGALIASVPNHYYFPEYRQLMGHWRHYTPESFQGLLSRFGLVISCYLNEHRRFNFIYFYIYATLEGLNLLLNRVAHSSKSLYERRVPLTNAKVYRSLLAPMLRPLKRLDEGKSIPRPSTFVVARALGERAGK